MCEYTAIADLLKAVERVKQDGFRDIECHNQITVCPILFAELLDAYDACLIAQGDAEDARRTG